MSQVNLSIFSETSRQTPTLYYVAFVAEENIMLVLFCSFGSLCLYLTGNLMHLLIIFHYMHAISAEVK